MKGKYIIISAPSGAGKSTLIKAIKGTCADCNLAFSVSMTTREPRKGEVDGEQYCFVTSQEFQKCVENDELLEWEEVHGNLYGTPCEPVERMVSEGKNVIFDIDVKGAYSIKYKIDDTALAIFIMPPSVEELRKRLVSRGTEPIEKIDQRMKRVEKEMAYSNGFDKIIVNDDLDKATAELTSIIRKYLNK